MRSIFSHKLRSQAVSRFFARSIQIAFCILILIGSAAFAGLDLLQKFESSMRRPSAKMMNSKITRAGFSEGKSSNFLLEDVADVLLAQSSMRSLARAAPELLRQPPEHQLVQRAEHQRAPRADYSSTVVSTKVQTFSNTASDCNQNQSCALSGVQFVEYKKIFRFKGELEKLSAHFTDTRFVIKTNRVADLESFGVVQFIRGCMFRTRLVNGVPTKELSVSRNEFGNTTTFQHKSWEIDNDVNDPLISAETGYGRFALLRWNKDPQNIATDGSTLYGNAKPPHGTVFLSDLPTAGSLMPTLNVSDDSTLEFKTCIFKIQDLPLTTDIRGTNVNPTKALFCAHWTHNYVFNFVTQKTDEPKSADPICEVSETANVGTSQN